MTERMYCTQMKQEQLGFRQSVVRVLAQINAGVGRMEEDKVEICKKGDSDCIINILVDEESRHDTDIEHNHLCAKAITKGTF